MRELLLFADLTAAVLAIAAALTAGVRATAPPPRLRRWLLVLAVVVAARLVIACLLLSGGVLLADSRLLVQVPLAVAPTAVAMWRPGRTTAHVAAAGVLLSVWWLLLPFGPQDTAYVLAVSLGALVLIGVLSVLLGRRRAAGSRVARLPWLIAAFLLVPAATLAVSGQANASAGSHEHGGSMSVAQLTGPRTGEPDIDLTLTAARGPVRLASGRTVDGLTFNGQSPGPLIRARTGRLVQVTLINTDVSQGVTLHWHGVDVPNAEDGVPGVTQDAVPPGGRHVYRFVPTRAGTFWYHTHRDGLHTVQRGLFGALIVEDGPVPEDVVDRTVFTHLWPGDGDGIAAVDRGDRPAREAVPAGRAVRLRLVNSSQEAQRVLIGGASVTVAAIDGNPMIGGTPLAPGTDLLLAAGGRHDVTFTMPDAAVTVALSGSPDATLAFSPGAGAEPATLTEGALFDPISYGTAQDQAPGSFHRTYDLRLDDGFGFSQGRLGYVSSLINGRLHPAVPALRVALGERVRVRVASRSIIDHPLHLHGHRVRVLTRDGTAVSGSPWWTDTLNVAPGEVFEIAFTADNPGIWMDHCHNFQHGANGMVMHLAYDGVGSPYSAGHSPE